MYTFSTSGVCSREINFDIEDNKVKNLNFVGGCPGNLLGISKIVEGMEVEDIITKLQGTRCGFKETSCPDQLTKALTEYLEKH